MLSSIFISIATSRSSNHHLNWLLMMNALIATAQVRSFRKWYSFM